MNCGRIGEKKLCGNVCEKQKSARATQWRETSGKRLRGAIPQMEPHCYTTQTTQQRSHGSSPPNKDLTDGTTCSIIPHKISQVHTTQQKSQRDPRDKPPSTILRHSS